MMISLQRKQMPPVNEFTIKMKKQWRRQWQSASLYASLLTYIIFVLNFSAVHCTRGIKHVHKPLITSKTNNVGFEGEQLEFNCTVEADMTMKLEFKWELPKGGIAEQEGRVQIILPILEKHENNSTVYNATGRLVVNNVQKTKDAGVYKCFVEDESGNLNSGVWRVQKILGDHEYFIEFNEPLEKLDTLIVESSTNNNDITHMAKWYIRFSGYPKPTLVWLDLHGNEIPWSTIEDRNRKFNAIIEEDSTSLKIHHPKISDSGYYTLYADNGQIQKEQKFQLLVKDKPQTKMQDVSVKPGDVAEVRCEIFGFPPSAVSFTFVPCEKVEYDLRSCDQNQKITYANEMIETVQATPFNQTSTLVFRPNRTGIIECIAINSVGMGDTKANLIVNDLDDDLSIWNENDLPILVGDNVSIWCGAAAYKYANELNWYKDDVLIQNGNGVQVITNDTLFSHRKEIRWNSITSAAAGKYVCRANIIKDDSPDFKSWDLQIVEPSQPSVIESNFENGQVLRSELGKPLKLRCHVQKPCFPRPKASWYKDGVEIIPESNEARIITLEDNTVLDILFIRAEDEGQFKCVAENQLGSVARELTLEITNLPKINRPALTFGVIGFGLGRIFPIPI